jgi:hypothetical protein
MRERGRGNGKGRERGEKKESSDSLSRFSPSTGIEFGQAVTYLEGSSSSSFSI